MTKFVIVTASALALGTAAMPTFVAEVAAQPVATKVQVADTFRWMVSATYFSV
ncbi:hypothetical protein [Bradyrhizobium embrapense]|uniref:hypothetical protein n=1 Tax=Bradyrhizobium embrapense TaxID=630921 RepID=UPI000AB8DEB6|nr:hypothetical protein [Bradyrhizobium embrapense]